MPVKTYFRVPIKRALKLIHKTKAKVFYPPKGREDFIKDHWSAAGTDIKAYLQNRTTVRIFFQEPNKSEIIKFYNQNPEKRQLLLTGAQQICRHVIRLFDDEAVDLGQTIDWHKDYKNDYRWDPRTFYTDIQIPYNQADIKFPWELSRLSHLITLGQAYVLTGDEKYTQEFIAQVSDWIDQNPYQHGVNWSCTMDVALRAVNCSAALFLFLKSTLIDHAFLVKFLNAIYHHGRHIRSNLEYNPVATGNHYLSNLLGLIYISCYFPEFKKSDEWKRFAIQEMKKEMAKQVYPDGTHYEASTCYHRLVLEIFVYSSLIPIINHPDFQRGRIRETGNQVFGKEYMHRLHTMFLALTYLLKPNGYMPQIGDNDNGQVHQWVQRDTLDMRYLLCLGAVFFGDSELKIEEFGFAEDCLWVYPPETYRTWNTLEGQKLATIQSKAFPDSGWYVMRHNKDYMVISCGPNGKKGEGTHAHNDKLSFELMINGTDQIIDPGSCTYTQNTRQRNLFRSTSYHNTVKIDSEEQNRIAETPDALWILEDNTKARALKWVSTPERDEFIGEHYGYRRLAKPATHQRKIVFHKEKSQWHITDTVREGGSHTLNWNFILAPEKSPGLTLKSDHLKFRTEPSYCSKGYGNIQKTEKITATAQLDGFFEIAVNIGIP